MRGLALAAALVACLVAGRASAASFQVDFSKPLVDVTGRAAQDCDHVNRTDPRAPYCDQWVTLTLGRLVAAALNVTEQNMKPEDIVTRGDLANAIRDVGMPVSTSHGVMTVDDRDVQLIRDLLPKVGEPNGITAQALEMLSPPASAK